MSAKDPIARLCHDQIEGTDNMGWPSKICYYWDNDSAGLSCGEQEDTIPKDKQKQHLTTDWQTEPPSLKSEALNLHSL